MEKDNIKELVTPREFGYYIYDAALFPNDTINGLKESLEYINIFYKADGTYLYELNEQNDFVDAFLSENNYVDNNMLTIIINEGKNHIRNSEYVLVNARKENANHIFVPIISKTGKEYVLAVYNAMAEIKDKNDPFIAVIKRVISVVSSHFEEYKAISKRAYEDELTGLYNRNEYIEEMKRLDKLPDKYVFAIFDLFRLKYINDTYNHKTGDDYIIKSAEILKKFFPEYYTIQNPDGSSRRVDTGNKIFKIGGDEFVVISRNSNIEMAGVKAQMASQEVKELDLGVEDQMQLGMNYGLSAREYMEPSNEIYQRADEELKNDKAAYYKALGVERRKQ